MKIDRAAGEERVIRLVGQHPVTQCVAQNERGLTKKTGILFGQGILKERVACAIQRIAKRNEHFHAGRAFAAFKHTDMLMADADKFAQLFLRETAGVAIVVAVRVLNSPELAARVPVLHPRWD